ncbi:MAG: hypothetical protein QXD55_01385 [Candidatus Aenigmatarchaeota archaeon]
MNYMNEKEKIFLVGLEDEGGAGSEGRSLPIYSIGCGTGRIYKMAEESNT